jgi:hypothetical protein
VETSCIMRRANLERFTRRFICKIYYCYYLTLPVAAHSTPRAIIFCTLGVIRALRS